MKDKEIILYVPAKKINKYIILFILTIVISSISFFYTKNHYQKKIRVLEETTTYLEIKNVQYNTFNETCTKELKECAKNSKALDKPEATIEEPKEVPSVTATSTTSLGATSNQPTLEFKENGLLEVLEILERSTVTIQNKISITYVKFQAQKLYFSLNISENRSSYKPTLGLGEEFNFFYFNIPLTIRAEALDNDAVTLKRKVTLRIFKGTP